MNINQLKWVAVAAVSGALSLTACQKKDQGNAEQIAKSDQGRNGNDTSAKNDTLSQGDSSAKTDTMAKNDAPESGSPNEGLNTQGNPGSPEIAHTGPQGSALAPQTDVTAPEKTVDQGSGANTLAANGKETATTPPSTGTQTSPGTALGTARKDDQQPSNPNDPQAGRDSAATAAADRLAKLDARVTDIRAHIDQLSNKTVFTDTLTDLKRLHETAQGAIYSIRDPQVKLDDARDAADRRMTQFEAAINSLQKRVERSASQTGA